MNQDRNNWAPHQAPIPVEGWGKGKRLSDVSSLKEIDGKLHVIFDTFPEDTDSILFLEGGKLDDIIKQTLLSERQALVDKIVEASWDETGKGDRLVNLNDIIKIIKER